MMSQEEDQEQLGETGTVEIHAITLEVAEVQAAGEGPGEQVVDIQMQGWRLVPMATP